MDEIKTLGEDQGNRLTYLKNDLPLDLSVAFLTEEGGGGDGDMIHGGNGSDLL